MADNKTTEQMADLILDLLKSLSPQALLEIQAWAEKKFKAQTGLLNESQGK